MTTFEGTKQVIENGNKKEIFNAIYLGSELGETIAMFLMECSSTFVKDIATKEYRRYVFGESFSITEKQAWCMVFEAIKIIHVYDAWVENVIFELEETEETEETNSVVEEIREAIESKDGMKYFPSSTRKSRPIGCPTKRMMRHELQQLSKEELHVAFILGLIGNESKSGSIVKNSKY